MVIGPRLDRPSAIGDEGRPRATSLSIAAFVVAGLFGATSLAVGRPELLPGIGSAVGVAVAGAALLGRNRIGALLLGHLGFLPFSSALLGLVVLLFAATPYGLLVAGFTVSMFGIAGSWTDVLNRQHVYSVVKQSLGSYLSMLFSVVAFTLVGSIGWLLFVLVRAFVGGVGPSESVVGFALLVCGSALSVRVALRALPVVALAPASRRQAFRERVALWRRVASRGAVGGIVVLVCFAGLWAAGLPTRVYAAVPGSAVLFRAFSSPFVAGPVVVFGSVCLVAAAVAWLARWLTCEFDPSSARRTAAIVAGGLLVMTAAPLVAAALSLRGPFGLLVAVVVAFFGPPFVFLVAGIGLAAVELGVLPDRASGPALAGAGLVVAAIGAGAADLASPLVFACAAGALVVWDVSSFGLGVTAELGHLPETRRLELLNGVLGVGLGVLAVVVLTGLDFLRTHLGPAGGSPSAAVLAVVGVLVVLALLRG